MYTGEQIQQATERMNHWIEIFRDSQSPAQQRRVAELRAGLENVPAFLDSHPDYSHLTIVGV